MLPHENPHIVAMWQRAVKTVLNLAPQMPPDQVKSLADAITVPPPEPAPAAPPATPAGKKGGDGKDEPGLLAQASSSSPPRRRPGPNLSRTEAPPETQSATLSTESTD